MRQRVTITAKERKKTGLRGLREERSSLHNIGSEVRVEIGNMGYLVLRVDTLYVR